MIARRLTLGAFAAACAGVLGPLAAPAAAQTGPGLGAVGVAGAYMGLARGHQALWWNPANLALTDRRRWSLGLPEIVAAGGTIGPEFRDLPTLLDEELTDAERAEFLAKVPASGVGFRGNVEIPLAGLSLGGFALALSTTALVDASLGRELVDLYLYTRQYGDIDYARIDEYGVGNTVFSDARYSTLMVGYGRTLPLTFGLLHVGAAGRMVQGHEIQRGRIFEPVVDILAQDFAVPALAARSTGGTGFGLDVGAALQPIPGLTLGAAIENLLQTMSWNELVEVRGDRFTGRDLAGMTPADVQERLEPRDFDPTSASLEELTVVGNLFDGADFPRVLRLGATFEPIGGTALNGTLSTTAGGGDLHNGWPRYVALGIAQDLPIVSIFTLRAGVASSLSGASALTGGLSLNLGPLHLNTAIGRFSGRDDAALRTGFDFDDYDAGGAGAYRYAERLSDASGYIFGLGIEIGGR